MLGKGFGRERTLSPTEGEEDGSPLTADPNVRNAGGIRLEHTRWATWDRNTNIQE
jgi:hypothetical protein